MKLPYLTENIPAVSMTIKKFYEDFLVEEIPLYEPCGVGEHIYFQIEKQGISTMDAVKCIAIALDIPRKTIGCAGLKDAQAITRQWLSVEHIDPKRIEELNIKDINILQVSKHRNKLKTGHLKGNRFILKLRDVKPEEKMRVEESLSYLKKKGFPNYFGPQRFGLRGDTWQIGKALMAEDFEEAANLISGYPSESDYGQVKEARELFMAGDYEKSAEKWPRGFGPSEKLCRMMTVKKADYKKAVLSLDKKMLLFYVSAFQSWIFNEMLVRRLEKMDQVLEGDWARRLDSGALFLAEDAERETERAKNFEISIALPILGKKMRASKSAAALFEKKVFEDLQINPDAFLKSKPFRLMGDRRVVRIKPEVVCFEEKQDENGFYWQLDVTLPAGSYVTSLLREVAKEKLIDASLSKGITV